MVTYSRFLIQHDTYAAVGELGRAIALLNEGMSKSKRVKADVFSLLQYKNISRQEFVQETGALLKQFTRRAPKRSGIHPP
jgi:hypothetical protein